MLKPASRESRFSVIPRLPPQMRNAPDAKNVHQPR